MKVWVVPFPYDYHEQGEILVFGADTAEAALKQARDEVLRRNKWWDDEEWVEKRYLSKLGQPVLLNISTPYVNDGCNC